MEYTYKPRGVCATKIAMELEDGILKKATFTDGCDGNLKAVAALVEGLPVSEVRKRLSGIRCGRKETSCADQLVKGIDEALRNQS